MAGSRRDRDDEAVPAPPGRPPRRARSHRVPGAGPQGHGAPGQGRHREGRDHDGDHREGHDREGRPGKAAAAKRGTRAAATADAPRARRRLPVLALVLALLCVLAAAGVGLLLWQRLNPSSVDASILAAAREGVGGLRLRLPGLRGSVEGKLDVLTGDLREQYEQDLEQGGIIDTYEQVSATTRYEVLDVGLQQVNEAQDTATLVVFGQYVVESVNSGNQAAPEGSECQVTPEGAVLHADGRGAAGRGRRRLEDQRAHPAHHQLRKDPAQGNPSAWQSRERPSAGIMGSGIAPPLRGSLSPGCGAGRTGPPTWTAPEQG